MIQKIRDMQSSLDTINDEIGDLHTRGVIDGWDGTLELRMVGVL